MKPMWKAIVSFATFALLIFSALALILHSSFFISQSAIDTQVLPRAVNFLLNQYNSTIGLDAEYPNATTYWLYSDNFLASYVLQNVNPPNTTLVNISTNISRTLSGYLAVVPNPLNHYMILNSSVFAFYTSANYNVTHIGGSTIAITLNNGTSKLNPNNYADIAFLEALYYNKNGQKGEAVSLFENGSSMYNGIGMNDSAFRGTYQTYKLALYIYSAEFLDQNYSASAETTLLKMQGSNGGFYTGYNACDSTAGTLTNVETTSLAILALSVPNPQTKSLTQTTTSQIQILSSSSSVSTSTSSVSIQTASSTIIPTSGSASSSGQTPSSISISSIFPNSTKSASSVSTSPSLASSNNFTLLYIGVAGVVVLFVATASLVMIMRKKKA
jgi:hypothetical protein